MYRSEEYKQAKEKLDLKFKQKWSNIIEKYSNIQDEGDIVDLENIEIIQDNGHLRSIRTNASKKVEYYSDGFHSDEEEDDVHGRYLENGGIIQNKNNSESPNKKSQILKFYKQRKSLIYSPDSSILRSKGNTDEEEFRNIQSAEKDLYFTSRGNDKYSRDEYQQNHSKLFSHEYYDEIADDVYDDGDITNSPTAKKSTRNPFKSEDNKILQKIKLMKKNYSVFNEDFEINNDFADSAFEYSGYVEENDSLKGNNDDATGDAESDYEGSQEESILRDTSGNSQDYVVMKQKLSRSFNSLSVDKTKSRINLTDLLKESDYNEVKSASNDSTLFQHVDNGDLMRKDGRNLKEDIEEDIIVLQSNREFCEEQNKEIGESSIAYKSVNLVQKEELEYDQIVVVDESEESVPDTEIYKAKEAEEEKAEISKALEKNVEQNESEESSGKAKVSEEDEFHIIDINDEVEESYESESIKELSNRRSNVWESLVISKRKPMVDLLNEQYQDIEEMFNDDTVIKYIRTSPTKKLKY